MLRLTKLADYGIVVMTYLAQEADQVRAANDVAGATGLALPTVSKVLKMLTRGGLVSSIRGARGGYRLARSPRTISVAEIIHALEGPFAMTECTSAEGACLQEGHCAVRANWKRINETVHQALSQVSLEQMVLPRAPAALVPAVAFTQRRTRTA
jgi:FeS assembly SUF system regulator